MSQAQIPTALPTAGQTRRRRYADERAGQRAFFNDYRGRVKSIKDKELEDILFVHSDGVINGNILEFKAHDEDTNKDLSQAIKYLSFMRLTGRPVPSNILLVMVNKGPLVYWYKSADFLPLIEKVYSGPASRGMLQFHRIPRYTALDLTDPLDEQKLVDLLNSAEFTKVTIDASCVLGWANSYYKANPTATKNDFLGSFDEDGKRIQRGEIRVPRQFGEYIEPYTAASNIEFDQIMDALNPALLRKELGAYYTPKAYCRKAKELIDKAIALVPEGNDYIILDRCAGTGNLEAVLDDDQLAHTIVSTYELHEYLVLLEKLGYRGVTILPPTPSAAAEATSGGVIYSADALEKAYVEHPLVKRHLDDPKTTVILLENPPFRDSSDARTDNKLSKIKERFIAKEYKSDPTAPSDGASGRDLLTLFIWSAFRFYLRYPTDSYIVFGPVKYFKSVHLVRKTFREGYLFNRKHFKATKSAVSCIWWQNIEPSKELDAYLLTAYDCEGKGTLADPDDANLVYVQDVTVRTVHKTFTEWFDRRDQRDFPDDRQTRLLLGTNGYPSDEKLRASTYRTTLATVNDNIVGYLRPTGFNLDPGNSCHLLTQILYSSRGFYLRNDNYLEKLPMFCAKQYPQKEWYETDVYFTTADGGTAYLGDDKFLKACFLYTCLSTKNKCVTFSGPDGHRYRNELCFHGDTVASRQLDRYTLNAVEKRLLDLWTEVLRVAQAKEEYDTDKVYGPYQIDREINIRVPLPGDRQNETEHKYSDLNTALKALRRDLDQYYQVRIQPKLFKYELLK